MIRGIRLLWLPIVMLGVAGFVAWLGVEVLTHPAPGAQPWLGWLLLGVAAIKAAIWVYVVRLRLKFDSTLSSRK